MYSLYDPKHTDKLKDGNYYIVQDGFGNLLTARFDAARDMFHVDGMPFSYTSDDGEYRIYHYTHEVAPHIDLGATLTHFQPVTINPKREAL